MDLWTSAWPSVCTPVPASSRHQDDQLKQEALGQTYPSGLESYTQTFILVAKKQGTKLQHHFLAEEIASG